MRCNSARAGERGGRPLRAFTLVEMMGVLAVIALVAALLVPATLRHLDRIASEHETARLQALSEALQKGVLRTRYIPSHTNWASVVAAQCGLDIGSVTHNVRGQARVLLIDSSGWLSTNLPYTQSQAGTPVLPANARMMLLSSLGAAVPVTNGMATATDFAALWNAAPGTVPWIGWNGDPYDVKIERVNLSPLFVRLVLTTYVSGTNGQYAVDSSATNEVPRNSGFAAYFLKNTVLKLYTGLPVSTFDSTQILSEDSSFVYEGGMWKSSIQGRVTLGVGDIAGIVAAFLSARANINAQDTNGNAQQVRVVQTFTDYMSNYNAWAEVDFTDNAMKTHLESVQVDMMDAVRGLYFSGAGYTHYPTNDSGCP